MPELCLFGPPAFDNGALLTRWPPERPYLMLAHLACRATWVSREAAAALLWPDRDQSRARANLRFVLLQARRLGQVNGLEVQADALRWVVDSDVRRLERAAFESRWADAIGEYRGPLLEGFEVGAPAPFVEWLQFERARLHGLWHGAMAERLARLCDDPEACLLLANRALQVDMLDETALAFQLRSLAALGRTDEARHAYRDYARRLATEFAIEPSATLRDLARSVDAQREPVRPAAPAGGPAPGAPSQGLVGRRTELGRIRDCLIGGGCRLLTITGTGGVGKSALARAALAQLQPGFADGMHWIALDDLQAASQVASRCAATVGIAPSATESPQRLLVERLRQTRTLLVFDNAEHLADFAAWLGELLAACEGVRALVTSRVRLGLADEWLLPLEGLPVPDVDETEVDALRAFDSVHLFELRACRVQVGFDARACAADVAALVRCVEGLPLAIELAAAWVRLLPVAEIRRELARSLDLLDDAGVRRGKACSVRESLEHSWRLLEPAEQRAMMGLAVFQGSFSREAARVVAEAALPVLAALADKSLLRSTGGARFAFHPLVLQFALEKLVQAGPDQEGAARTRHAEYFLRLLARYNDFHAIDQRLALEAIGGEIENTLAAWDWAITRHRVDLIGECASALESYLDAQGRQQLGLELFTRAAAEIDAALPSHQRARCHVQLARAAFCYRRGDFAEGERAARAALQAAQRTRYGFGVKSSTNTLGLMLWRLGRIREAAFCLRDVLRRARADADRAAIPLYALNLGRIEIELGNDDEGERLIGDALEASRRDDNQVGIQAALNELCALQLDRRRPRAVLPLAQEGLALCESTGFRCNAPYFHRALADAYWALDDPTASAEHARGALEAVAAGGDRTLEPACRIQLARVALRAGRRAQALSELQLAGRLALAMHSPRVQVAVVAACARWCRQGGQAGRARSLAQLAARHPAASRRERESLDAELAEWQVGAGPSGHDEPLATLEQALDLLQALPP
jgi:DNA-binding SARP family transcriptional activator/predicted ATPase